MMGGATKAESSRYRLAGIHILCQFKVAWSEMVTFPGSVPRQTLSGDICMLKCDPSTRIIHALLPRHYTRSTLETT